MDEDKSYRKREKVMEFGPVKVIFRGNGVYAEKNGKKRLLKEEDDETNSEIEELVGRRMWMKISVRIRSIARREKRDKDKQMRRDMMVEARKRKEERRKIIGNEDVRI